MYVYHVLCKHGCVSIEAWIGLYHFAVLSKKLECS